MTVIAYRDGVLAADGRETWCEDRESTIIIGDACVKIWRLPDGSLFGAAHSSEDIERLRLALIKNQPPPKLDDVAGMRIDRRGRIWMYEGNIWQRVNAKFFAVGSGARFAIPAMKAGASAVKAVKIGIECDPYSGGKITVLKLRK